LTSRREGYAQPPNEKSALGVVFREVWETTTDHV